MKLTTQLTIVIVSGILGIVGLIVGLAVLADWSDGAIIAMVTAFSAVIVNTIIAVRNQAKTAEVLQGQDDKLDTVVEQTNGLSHIEKQDIAKAGATAAIAQLKTEGHL